MFESLFHFLGRWILVSRGKQYSKLLGKCWWHFPPCYPLIWRHYGGITMHILWHEDSKSEILGWSIWFSFCQSSSWQENLAHSDRSNWGAFNKGLAWQHRTGIRGTSEEGARPPPRELSSPLVLKAGRKGARTRSWALGGRMQLTPGARGVIPALVLFYPSLLLPVPPLGGTRPEGSRQESLSVCLHVGLLGPGAAWVALGRMESIQCTEGQSVWRRDQQPWQRFPCVLST